MRILATFDADNYQDTNEVYEKYSVRAVIMREGKLAMQCDGTGEYKLPGGGMEAGESRMQTLIREVKEETGLHVIEETVTELGEMIEIHRDIFEPAKKYICHSLFYYCKVVDGLQDMPHLTASERAKGYELKWATPQEICARNSANQRDSWIIRDTAFVRMLAEHRVVLPGGES